MLEHILLDDKVDLKTLLFAQRVSKTFQATIQGSVKLLRKLWMLPDTGEKNFKFNPLLARPPSNNRDVLFYPGRKLNVSHGNIFLQLDLNWVLETRSGSWQKMQFIRTQNEKEEVRCGINANVIDRYSGRFTFLRESWVMEIDHAITFEAFLQMARAKIGERQHGLLDEKGRVTFR